MSIAPIDDHRQNNDCETTVRAAFNKTADTNNKSRIIRHRSSPTAAVPSYMNQFFPRGIKSELSDRYRNPEKIIMAL